VVAGLVLAAVALVGYGPYVGEGGFYSDDWNFAAIYQHATGDGVWPGFSALLDIASSRPVGTAYAAGRYALFGLDPTGHLVVAGLLWLAVAGLLYALLRMLGMSPLYGCAIAVLALLFPLADSTRLWPAASALNLGIALYLAGTIAALAGLRATGARSVVLHGVAVILYLASVLTYEATTVAVLLSFGLYSLRARGRRVAVRWAVDAAAVGVALLVATTQSPVERAPISELPHRAGEVISGGLMVISWSVVPIGGTTHFSPARLLGGLIVVAIVAAAIRRVIKPGAHAPGPPPRLWLAVGDERSAELRRWLTVAAGGVVAIAAGYLVLLPVDGYNPAHRGIANRVNAFSSLGMAVLVVSLAMLAALLVSRWSRRATTALAMGLVGVVAVGYASRLYSDEGNWHDAAVDQDRILDTIGASPPLGDGDSLVAFRVPAFAAPGVPVFHETWDLTGALRLRWGSDSLEAYPANNGRVITCRPAGVHVTADDPRDLSYGRTRFFAADTGRSQDIGSRAACETWRPAGVTANRRG
jgi:hypothetical protein